MPDTRPTRGAVEQRLSRLIAAHGPISVAQYMAESNAHYYASRDPLGTAGDFTTAPEISQMFGELVGLWLADLWHRSGRPAHAHYVELGPGRGTLAADALRAISKAGLSPTVELVETSPVLRRAQAARLGGANWHDDVSALPEQGPLLVVANEFFDALPIRQLVAGKTAWHERLVGHDGNRFLPTAGPGVGTMLIPEPLRGAPPGTIMETCPAAVAIVQDLASRIAVQGGAMLIVDYGHPHSGAGETLQAVASHLYADPWSAPGERDLTAHVDFEPLAAVARREGLVVAGPVEQGAWLLALGIDVRAAELAKSAPERSGEIARARDRLVAPEEMGSLFKVMALIAPVWADPAAFR